MCFHADRFKGAAAAGMPATVHHRTIQYIQLQLQGVSGAT